MRNELKTLRIWIASFMVLLALSGLTAIPAETELHFLCQVFPLGTSIGDWLDSVYLAVAETGRKYPFLLYGNDWLAFAHVVLAILFIGPYRDPVRNRWVIEFGVIACLLVLPWAFIFGAMRGIPLWWRLVDCSFGVFGLVPLLIVLRKITVLENSELKTEEDGENI